MDIGSIILYILQVILSIAAVAKVRDAAKKKSEEFFFGRGRGSMVLIFGVSIIWQLVSGHFEQLDTAQGILDLVQQALQMAGVTIATHMAGSGLKSQANKLAR